MVSVALRGYGMDLVTNNPAQIRAYLAQNQAPADYVLPAALQKTAVTGCAIQDWQGDEGVDDLFPHRQAAAAGPAKRPLAVRGGPRPVKDAPPAGSRPFVQVSRLGMVTWTEGDKLYVLGTEGDEQALRQYL